MSRGSNTIRVRPAELTIPLTNPHKGFSTFQKFNGDECYQGASCPPEHGPEEFDFSAPTLGNGNYPATTTAYCRWFWSQLEPQRGKYRWELVEKALHVAKLRQQTLGIRLMPNGTWANHAPAPIWYAATAPVRRDSHHSEHFFPDYNSAEYYHLWSEFIAAFAARFDHEPRIDYIDAAYNGAWGEGGVDACMEPGSNERMAQFYLDTFKQTQILSLTNPVQFKYMIQKNTGWRADCFGDLTNDAYENVPAGSRWNHMYDLYPQLGALAGDAWQTAPVVLESAWTVGYWHENSWPVDWIIEQGLKYHCSICMAKSAPVPAAWFDKMTNFADRMGYRYVMRQLLLQDQVTLGCPLPITVWIENNGVAPVYQPYEFKLLFRQNEQTFSTTIDDNCCRWLPGDRYIEQSVVLPKALKCGRVSLSCCLQHKNIPDLTISFANLGNSPNGELWLTDFEII